MSSILQFIMIHWVALESGGGLLLVAAIQNLPPPGTPWSGKTIYCWMYDTLQTVLPVRRPTPPGHYPALQTQTLTKIDQVSQTTEVQPTEIK